jgi:hypothetical protein
VFYIDYNVGKGPHRWRTGIIIQRKRDFFYHSSRRTTHGYDIYDVENCTHVTRTRKDIRKYRPTKMEREAMEQINRNLASIREEYEKNKEFIGKGFKLPPKFILDGYDDPPAPTTKPTTMETPGNPQPGTQEPTTIDPEESPEAETTGAQSEDPAAPEPAAQIPDPGPNQTKQPRMLSRISDDLNGPLWRIEPLTKRTRRVVYTIEYGDPEATPEDGDLEPVYIIEYKDPGTIPDDDDSEPNADPSSVSESTNAPEQETLVNGDN